MQSMHNSVVHTLGHNKMNVCNRFIKKKIYKIVRHTLISQILEDG